MTEKERFLDLCKGIRREGIDKLMNWLEESDFYTAPASTRFHGNYEGGLLEHSLHVYDEMKRLLEVYGKDITVSEDTIRIVSLFHDLCKVYMYATEKRNRKNAQGQWESYDAYKVDEKFCYGSHGGKSVYLIQRFMQLTDDEAVAINCHMGSWDGDRYISSAYEQFPLAWLLHVADESSTFIVERTKNNG